MIVSSDTCNLDGAAFNAVNGSIAVAGYTEEIEIDQHSIIIGNDNKTILFGGIWGLFNIDSDADTKADILELIENAIVNVDKGGQTTKLPTLQTYGFLLIFVFFSIILRIVSKRKKNQKKIL